MAKGRTLTTSEKFALNVIQKLQALGAVPQGSYGYCELGRITKRSSVAEKEGIKTEKATPTYVPAFRPGNPVLIRTRLVVFRWDRCQVNMELQHLINMAGQDTKPLESRYGYGWTPIKLEIRGLEPSYDSVYKSDQYILISLENRVSVRAFLALGTANAKETFY